MPKMPPPLPALPLENEFDGAQPYGQKKKKKLIDASDFFGSNDKEELVDASDFFGGLEKKKPAKKLAPSKYDKGIPTMPDPNESGVQRLLRSAGVVSGKVLPWLGEAATSIPSVATSPISDWPVLGREWLAKFGAARIGEDPRLAIEGPTYYPEDVEAIRRTPPNLRSAAQKNRLLSYEKVARSVGSAGEVATIPEQILEGLAITALVGASGGLAAPAAGAKVAQLSRLAKLAGAAGKLGGAGIKGAALRGATGAALDTALLTGSRAAYEAATGEDTLGQKLGAYAPGALMNIGFGAGLAGLGAGAGMAYRGAKQAIASRTGRMLDERIASSAAEEAASAANVAMKDAAAAEASTKLQFATMMRDISAPKFEEMNREVSRGYAIRDALDFIEQNIGGPSRLAEQPEYRAAYATEKGTEALMPPLTPFKKAAITKAAKKAAISIDSEEILGELAAKSEMPLGVPRALFGTVNDLTDFTRDLMQGASSGRIEQVGDYFDTHGIGHAIEQRTGLGGKPLSQQQLENVAHRKLVIQEMIRAGREFDVDSPYFKAIAERVGEPHFAKHLSTLKKELSARSKFVKKGFGGDEDALWDALESNISNQAHLYKMLEGRREYLRGLGIGNLSRASKEALLDLEAAKNVAAQKGKGLAHFGKQVGKIQELAGIKEGAVQPLSHAAGMKPGAQEKLGTSKALASLAYQSLKFSEARAKSLGKKEAGKLANIITSSHIARLLKNAEKRIPQAVARAQALADDLSPAMEMKKQKDGSYRPELIELGEVKKGEISQQRAAMYLKLQEDNRKIVSLIGEVDKNGNLVVGELGVSPENASLVGALLARKEANNRAMNIIQHDAMMAAGKDGTFELVLNETGGGSFDLPLEELTAWSKRIRDELADPASHWSEFLHQVNMDKILGATVRRRTHASYILAAIDRIRKTPIPRDVNDMLLAKYADNPKAAKLALLDEQLKEHAKIMLIDRQIGNPDYEAEKMLVGAYLSNRSSAMFRESEALLEGADGFGVSKKAGQEMQDRASNMAEIAADVNDFLDLTGTVKGQLLEAIKLRYMMSGDELATNIVGMLVRATSGKKFPTQKMSQLRKALNGPAASFDEAMRGIEAIEDLPYTRQVADALLVLNNLAGRSMQDIISTTRKIVGDDVYPILDRMNGLAGGGMLSNLATGIRNLSSAGMILWRSMLNDAGTFIRMLEALVLHSNDPHVRKLSPMENTRAVLSAFGKSAAWALSDISRGQSPLDTVFVEEILGRSLDNLKKQIVSGARDDFAGLTSGGLKGTMYDSNAIPNWLAENPGKPIPLNARIQSAMGSYERYIHTITRVVDIASKAAASTGERLAREQVGPIQHLAGMFSKYDIGRLQSGESFNELMKKIGDGTLVMDELSNVQRGVMRYGASGADVESMKPSQKALYKKRQEELRTGIKGVAIEEAEELVFHKHATLGNVAQQVKRGMNAINLNLLTGGKGSLGLGDILAKFIATGGSLIQRGFELTPLGAVPAATKYIVKFAKENDPVKKGYYLEKALRKVVDGGIGSSFGLYFGAWAFRNGIITTSDTMSQAEGASRRELGYMPNSINLDAMQRSIALPTGNRDSDGEPLFPQEGDRLLRVDWALPLWLPVKYGMELERQRDMHRKRLLVPSEGLTEEDDATLRAIYETASEGVPLALRADYETFLNVAKDSRLISPLLSAVHKVFSGTESTIEDTAGYDVQEAVGESLGVLFNAAGMQVTPAFIRSMRYMLDNVDRETRTKAPVLDSIINQTPILSFALRPRIGPSGEPTVRQHASEMWFSPFSRTKILDKPALRQAVEYAIRTGDKSLLPLHMGKKTIQKSIDLTDIHDVVNSGINPSDLGALIRANPSLKLKMRVPMPVQYREEAQRSSGRIYTTLLSDIPVGPRGDMARIERARLAKNIGNKYWSAAKTNAVKHAIDKDNLVVNKSFKKRIEGVSP